MKSIGSIIRRISFVPVAAIALLLLYGGLSVSISAGALASPGDSALPSGAPEPAASGFDALAFHPNGKFLATVRPGEAPQIALWDIASGQTRFLPSFSGGGVTRLVFSPNGEALASATRQGEILLWDLVSGELRRTLGSETDAAVSDVVFSRDGRLVASVAEDATVRLWDAQVGSLLSVLSGGQQGVARLAFSPDGAVLAGGRRDGEITLWDVNSGQVRSTLSVGAGLPLINPVFSPIGGILASVAEDGRIVLFDWQDGSLKHVLEGHQDRVTGIAFSPDGAILASASEDSVVRLWDVDSGEVRSTFSDGSGAALAGLLMSPDGNTLATIATDSMIRLWGVPRGDLQQQLMGHTDVIADAAFSSTRSDQQTFASVARGGRVIVWNVATGVELKAFQLPGFSLSGLDEQSSLSESTTASNSPALAGDSVASSLPTSGEMATAPAASTGACAAPPNAIVAENCMPGNSALEWDVLGVGDESIQGFATDISVDRGQTVDFKIDTDADSYHLDVYRMGYYGGQGARKVATVLPSVSLPQNQPSCLTDETTGLIDCGNWSVSASWDVPDDATSGIYFVKAVRDDAGGGSHIFFIVRDDSGVSDLLFQTSDATWQAYNDYGGNSLYVGEPAGRAYAVSYNRPIRWRSGSSYAGVSNVFNAEYPMVRWLEANGYDVSYFSGVDSDRRGELIQNHAVFLSVGHDEYWSAQQRENVEDALAAGVNLSFFSGNEVFWKARWEQSIDGPNTPYRTLVCYKETHANFPIDPSDPPTWTGTWRDPRFSPPADGGRPENALTGQLFTVNGIQFNDLTVGPEHGRMRFWRNTGLDDMGDLDPPVTVGRSLLGFEWDEDVDNGHRPPGLFRLSSTSADVGGRITDYGSSFAPGVATHTLTLYQHDSGAMVFGAGTVQWSWGLDGSHDNNANAPDDGPDVRIQQATVNLFADMGVQPSSPQSGLVAASASTDVTPPFSTISSPSTGLSVEYGIPITITGTADDTGGGLVAGVEVSVDGGETWHPAAGRSSWTYTWTPTEIGAATIQSRAVDDSGNLEMPFLGVGVTVLACTNRCTIWPATAVPGISSDSEALPLELGVKFGSDVAGTVTGIRFYKGTANTGTHVGNLWSSDGVLLASATFTHETASGWQEVNFATPVPITANTVYFASYHAPNGGFALDRAYFTTSGFQDSANPLYALSDGESAGNGVFLYGAGGFPTSTYAASNYWVDVVFSPGPAPTLSSIAVTPANPTILVGETQQFTATGTYSDSTTQDLTAQVEWTSSSPTVATVGAGGSATGVSAGLTNISATLSGITASTGLTVHAAPLSIATESLPNGTVDVAYSATLVATGGTGPYSWSIASGSLPAGLTLTPATGAIDGTPTAAATYDFTVQVTDSASPAATFGKALSISIGATQSTIWPITAVPGVVDGGPDSAVELGVKFSSDVSGTLTGIRFYKASTNTGTHVGNLWSSAGTLLATATFTDETASGWQQVNFSNPVPINADTIYVASYHTSTGHYSFDLGYFAGAGVDNPPLHALADGVSGGNGVYVYNTSSAFPSQTYAASNYWVDVAFSPGPAPTLSSIAVTPANPTILVGETQQFTATGTYSGSTTQDLTAQVEWTSSSPTVATVGAGGSATGVSAGLTNISATLSGITASTGLTVHAAPLSIATESLPNGTVDVAYSATLVATGGTGPYSWSIASGSLPAGLTLTPATGAIDGTPTAAATYDFTVQVTDSASPAATFGKALSISIGATQTTIWPITAVPGVVDGGPDSAVELGVKFRSDVSGTLIGIRFYKASTNTGTHVGNLWSSAGTLLATATFTDETASGWQQVNFSNPVPINADTVYVASYHTSTGHYSVDSGYFAAAYSNGPLSAPADGENGGNGVYLYGSGGFPTNTWESANYWVDVVLTTNTGPDADSGETGQ